MSNDLPPWPAAYQQTRCWIEAEDFAAIIADPRELACLGERRAP